MLWTLRYGDEERPEAEYFSDIKAKKPDLPYASAFAPSSTSSSIQRKWSPDLIIDPVEDRLIELIALKKKAIKKSAKAKAKEAPVGSKGNAVDLMAAPKKSSR